MNDLVVSGETDRGWIANDGGASEWTNGLKMIDGATDAADAFARGDFIEGTVNGLSAGIDVVGAMLNPFGAAGSMVVGWLIEHIGPVQDWLDDMLGDPAAIKGGAQTWHNIEQHMRSVSSQYADEVSRALAGMRGPAADAYGEYASLQRDLMDNLARVCSGVAAGVEVAGGLLAGVRDFVSGLVADFVGQVIGAFAQSVITVGLGAPAALAGLAAKGRSIVSRVQTFMEDLARSLDRMAELLGEISPALESATRAAASMARHAGGMNDYELNFIVSMSKAAGAANNG
jgi:hypothetical protein